MSRSSHESAAPGSERAVYVLASEAVVDERADPHQDLRLIWGRIWRRRSKVVIVTLAFVSAAIVYSLFATHWFKAEVTLAPVTRQNLPSGLGQLAGLASLAGIAIPASGSTEAIATLRSRDFAAQFISDRGLVPVLFANRWDAMQRVWKRSLVSSEPQLGDAVKFFREKVLVVEEDKKSGLVVLSVRWTEPKIAALWANELVRRLNDRMRAAAVSESERNIAFLREQIVATTLVPLQQSISRVLENEIQKLMLAKGNAEFAFKVIDPATVPIEKFKPQRILITLLSTIFGFFVGALLAVAKSGDVKEKVIG